MFVIVNGHGDATIMSKIVLSKKCIPVTAFLALTQLVLTVYQSSQSHCLIYFGGNNMFSPTQITNEGNTQILMRRFMFNKLLSSMSY